MRVLITSDFHLEFGADPDAEVGRLADADVIVIAGDLHLMRFLDQARDAFLCFSRRYDSVIYVPGNHDYYRSDPEQVDGILRVVEQEIQQLSVLRPERPVVIDGRRFFGGTMWFPDGVDNIHYEGLINDFSLIGLPVPGSARRAGFKPWVYNQNQLFRLHAEGIQEDDIVITHHLPSFRSVAPAYLTDRGNIFFVSPMDELIERKRPRLWIHGHTHFPMDYYMPGGTRVICNPRGYLNELNGFDPNKTVEV